MLFRTRDLGHAIFENAKFRSTDTSSQSSTTTPRSSISSCYKQSQTRHFLDLPSEIRLQIYEAIFPPASVVLQSGDNTAMIALLQNFPQFISRGSRDVQLFRTCRTCHNEAARVFYRSINLLVYQHLHLLRLSFLLRIGPINGSYIRRATITPIGLPGEHFRLLECLGPRHGGLVGLEHLTLEIWNSDHVPAFVSTCQELIQHHKRLKIIFGRGIDMTAPLQPEDIPANLRLSTTDQKPGYREHIIDSFSANDSSSEHLPHYTITRDFTSDNNLKKYKDNNPDNTGGRPVAPRPVVSFSIPEPKRTILSRYKLRRKDKKEQKEKKVVT